MYWRIGEESPGVILGGTPGLYNTNTVLYIDISNLDYKHLCKDSRLLANRCGGCPRCKARGFTWRIHGWYRKYWRAEPLLILRLQCPVCWRTHAVMPSFSVPHASHDTADIDAYLAARHAGQTRRQAAEGLGLEAFSCQTLKRIDRRIHTRALIIKACEVPLPATNLTGYPFLCAKAGCSTMVDALNRHYLLNNGRGWLFGNLLWLSRSSIAGTMPPHDLTSPRSAPDPIDSS
jgi:hypothetical protein